MSDATHILSRINSGDPGFRRVPGIIDPVAGLQVYDIAGHNDVVNAIVYINHQRRDGQSTILSYYPKDDLRDLWLKLPN